MGLKIKGVPELLKKLSPAVYQGPTVKALEEVTEVMGDVARSRARGSMIPSIKTDSSRISTSSALTTFPIGKVATELRHAIYLNSGSPGGKARWRGFDTGVKGKVRMVNGVQKRWGGGTKGWLTTVPKLAAVRRAAEAAMAKAAQELEALWQR